MRRLTDWFRGPGIAFVGLLVLAEARAQPPSPEPELQVGLGPGVVPEYPGSNIYQWVALPSVEWAGRGLALRTAALGFEVDVVPWKGLDAGPVIRFDTGRDDLSDVEDPVVERLEAVAASLALGGFAASQIPVGFPESQPPLFVTGRLAWVQGMGHGHGGSVVETDLGLLKPGNPVTVGVGLTTRWVDTPYARSYFGIDRQAAQDSGLAAFEARRGLHALGGRALIALQLTDRFAAGVFTAYSRLVGDAADSPVVTERGSPNQWVGGLTLRYTVF